MASMRVHELAKEFDMTSKELLDKLNEMKIPAKSHASMLADAYVAKIRKNLEPEIKQRAGQLEAEEAAELARERAEAEARKAEEERARREAVEQVRKMYPIGCRVELISMDDPYSSLTPGTKGTVRSVDDTGTVFVSWDNGSGLGVIYGVDRIRKL